MPDELRELLAEPHPGPPKLDAATKAASVAAVLAGTGAASASAFAAGTTATGVKLWLLIGGLCAGGVVAGVTLSADPEPATPAPPAAASPEAPRAEPAAPELEAVEPEPEETEAAPAVEPEVEGPAVARSTPRPPAPAGPDALRAEAALLESARAALEAEPRAALRATREHARAHPDGQLTSEREMIAIDALQRLGRGRAAERRARALLRSHPRGIYADRVRRLLEREPEPETAPGTGETAP